MFKPLVHKGEALPFHKGEALPFHKGEALPFVSIKFN